MKKIFFVFLITFIAVPLYAQDNFNSLIELLCDDSEYMNNGPKNYQLKEGQPSKPCEGLCGFKLGKVFEEDLKNLKNLDNEYYEYKPNKFTKFLDFKDVTIKVRKTDKKIVAIKLSYTNNIEQNSVSLYLDSIKTIAEFYNTKPVENHDLMTMKDAKFEWPQSRIRLNFISDVDRKKIQNIYTVTIEAEDLSLTRTSSGLE